MIETRDPKMNPQPGDLLKKQGKSYKWLSRRVLRRDGNDIFYSVQDGGPERRCWISSWMEWTREAEVCST